MDNTIRLSRSSKTKSNTKINPRAERAVAENMELGRRHCLGGIQGI